jgi:hypothetical protein
MTNAVTSLNSKYKNQKPKTKNQKPKTKTSRLPPGRDATPQGAMMIRNFRENGGMWIMKPIGRALHVALY